MTVAKWRISFPFDKLFGPDVAGRGDFTFGGESQAGKGRMILISVLRVFCLDVFDIVIAALHLGRGSGLGCL